MPRIPCVPIALTIALAWSTAPASAQTGIASTYHDGKSASGMPELTATHRSLPSGTLVRVTSKRIGKSVVVKIVDRGPFARGRVLGLHPAAAERIALNGHGEVSIQVAGRAKR